ncbi:MAG: DUF2273 domain-containing protein [Chitinophagales bacterium]
MWDKVFTYIMENHRGKAAGLILGLLAGILIISYGFWKAVFIVICVIAGFFFGKAIDDNTDFSSWWDNFRHR